MAGDRTVLFASVYDFTNEGVQELRSQTQPHLPPGAFLSYDQENAVFQLRGPSAQIPSASVAFSDRWQRYLEAQEELPNSQESTKIKRMPGSTIETFVNTPLLQSETPVGIEQDEVDSSDSTTIHPPHTRHFWKPSDPQCLSKLDSSLLNALSQRTNCTLERDQQAERIWIDVTQPSGDDNAEVAGAAIEKLANLEPLLSLSIKVGTMTTLVTEENLSTSRFYLRTLDVDSFDRLLSEPDSPPHINSFGMLKLILLSFHPVRHEYSEPPNLLGWSSIHDAGVEYSSIWSAHCFPSIGRGTAASTIWSLPGSVESSEPSLPLSAVRVEPLRSLYQSTTQFRSIQSWSVQVPLGPSSEPPDKAGLAPPQLQTSISSTRTKRPPRKVKPLPTPRENIATVDALNGSISGASSKIYKPTGDTIDKLSDLETFQHPRPTTGANAPSDSTLQAPLLPDIPGLVSSVQSAKLSEPVPLITLTTNSLLNEQGTKEQASASEATELPHDFSQSRGLYFERSGGRSQAENRSPFTPKRSAVANPNDGKQKVGSQGPWPKPRQELIDLDTSNDAAAPSSSPPPALYSQGVLEPIVLSPTRVIQQQNNLTTFPLSGVPSAAAIPGRRMCHSLSDDKSIHSLSSGRQPLDIGALNAQTLADLEAARAQPKKVQLTSEASTGTLPSRSQKTPKFGSKNKDTKSQKKQPSRQDKINEVLGPVPHQSRPLPSCDPKILKGVLQDGSAREGKTAEVDSGKSAASDMIKFFLSPMLAAARAFPGEVNFEVHIGQLLVKRLPEGLQKNKFTIEEISEIFQGRRAGVQIQPPSMGFYPMLTSNGKDADYIRDLKITRVGRMFAEDADFSNISYEFHCQDSKNESFVIEVDGNSGKTSLLKSVDVLCKVNLVYPARRQDAQLSVALMRHVASFGDVDAVLQEIRDTLYVPAALICPEVYFQLKSNEVWIDKVIVRRTTHHQSLTHPDTYVKIQEFHRLEVNRQEAKEHKAGVSYQAKALSLEKMLDNGRLWYEISLGSRPIQKLLLENSKLEVGGLASWQVPDITQDASFACLLDLTTALVNKIDAVGYHNNVQGVPFGPGLDINSAVGVGGTLYGGRIFKGEVEPSASASQLGNTDGFW